VPVVASVEPSPELVCHTLFGVRRASKQALARELGATVGIEESRGGATLRWRLRYATARRAESAEHPL